MVEFIYELAGYSEELAVYCLDLYVAELVLEECGVELEDVSESLEVGLWWIELENMEIGEVGIEPSIIVYINIAKGININASIFVYFPMILTSDIVDDILLVEAGC